VGYKERKVPQAALRVLKEFRETGVIPGRRGLLVLRGLAD
jgi:hypothetical protein